jgi:hypothetical protein
LNFHFNLLRVCPQGAILVGFPRAAVEPHRNPSPRGKMFVVKGQAFNFEFWAEEDDIRDIAAGA